MVDVVIGLVPAMIAAVCYFRGYAFVLIPTCVISCVAAEWLCNVIRGKANPAESLGDFSAVVTGIILALSVPPTLPIWAAVIGSAFAIAVGKMVFGGLGSNIFNPAMVGRAFLTACFGMLMTTWTVPARLPQTVTRILLPDTVSACKKDVPVGVLTLELHRITPANEYPQDRSFEAITQATPLAWSKQAIKAQAKAKIRAAELAEVEEGAESSAQPTAEVEAKRAAYAKAKEEAERCSKAVNESLKATFTGEVGGCLGETSVLALLIGGIYLLIRRTINFHIPLAVFVSAFVFAGVAHLVNPDAYAQPVFHLCSGGLLIGAFFIATDPVTAPLTTKGMWIFGAGVGALTVLIRVVGEYPEGVMYAVLLMNAVTPLIDRFCKLIPVGGEPSV
jgi:electron transport complex protein RnfD